MPPYRRESGPPRGCKSSVAYVMTDIPNLKLRRGGMQRCHTSSDGTASCGRSWTSWTVSRTKEGPWSSPGPQGSASPRSSRPPYTDGPPSEPFLTALAALNLLVEAAAERPILVAVDDVQRCDEASQEAMAFIARRIGRDPVGLIATRCEGHTGAFADLAVPGLRPSALDDRSSRELLARSGAGLDLADREHILRESLGNPLALVELPSAWRKARESGSCDGRAVPLAQPLTPRLEVAFAAHLDELLPLTRDTLLIAAVDDDAGLPEILSAASGLSGRQVMVDALEDAVRAQLVAFDGLCLRFRHPLIRSAIVGAEPVVRVLAANAALADVLGEEPHRQVWHRAQSVIGIDDVLADDLAASRTEALRRGSVLSAIKSLERSAELTADPAARGRRLLLAAEHAFGLGRAGLVDRLLRSAAKNELSELDRERKEWLREIFHDGRPGEADRVFELCAAAERSQAAGDTDLAWNLLIGAAQRCWWADAGIEARARVVRVAEVLTRQAPMPHEPAAAETVAAADPARVRTSSPKRADDPRRIVAIALAEPVTQGAAVAAALARFRFTHDSKSDTLLLLGRAAHAIGDLPLAVDLLGRAEPMLREEGRLGLHPHVLPMLAIDHLLHGDWQAGSRAVQEGRRVAEETGQPIWSAAALSVGAVAQSLNGTAESTRVLVAAEDAANHLRLGSLLARVQVARGLEALTADRPEQAFGELRRAFDPDDPSHHQRESFGAVMFLAEAAVHSGHGDEARQI